MTDSIDKLSCCSVSRDSALTFASFELKKQKHFDTISQSAKKDMIYLPGGEFLMGTDDREGFPSDGEGPVRSVTVGPYYIDPCTVTNLEFKSFVDATGYVTEAEKFGWSFVFHLFVPENGVMILGSTAQAPWWLAVEGACWRALRKGTDQGLKIEWIIQLFMCPGTMR